MRTLSFWNLVANLLTAEFDRVWYWRKLLPERKGQECRILARGGKNSILVEFRDGHKVLTSAFAVRKKQ